MSPPDISGFTDPGRVARFQRRRAALHAELVTSAALLVGIVVGVIAVSVGIAHAETPGAVAEQAPVAALVGFVLIGMGGLTALAAGRGEDGPRE